MTWQRQRVHHRQRAEEDQEVSLCRNISSRIQRSTELYCPVRSRYLYMQVRVRTGMRQNITSMNSVCDVYTLYEQNVN